jgi:hypothetical protein
LILLPWNVLGVSPTVSTLCAEIALYPILLLSANRSRLWSFMVSNEFYTPTPYYFV